MSPDWEAPSPGWQGFRSWVLQDWEANHGRRDAQIILAWFRCAQWARAREHVLSSLIDLSYGVVVVSLLKVELLPGTRVGPELHLPHPQDIVINSTARIGARCMIRNGVSIGNKTHIGEPDAPSPLIGSGVEFGVGAVVLGAITVGDNSQIGANAVVVHDVAAGDVVGGVPARVIRRAE